MEITDHEIGTVGRTVRKLLTTAPEPIRLAVTGPVFSSCWYPLWRTWMASGLQHVPT